MGRAVLVSTYENWDPVHGTQYYTGQSVYRGDVAMIRMSGSYRSDWYMYRGGPSSSAFDIVESYFTRRSQFADTFSVGGQKTGETGTYSVDLVGIDVVYEPPSDIWAKNVTTAVKNATPCVDKGDSGGSVFDIVSGQVKAAGVLSGMGPGNCRIYFTDIHLSNQGLPGDPYVH